MDVGKGYSYFSSEEFNRWLFEDFTLNFLGLYIGKKFTTVDKLHDEVEPVLGLKCKLHINDKWCLHLGQNIALVHNLGELGMCILKNRMNGI